MNQSVQNLNGGKLPFASLAKSGESPGKWGKRNSTGVAFASSLMLDRVTYKSDENRILKSLSLNVAPGEILSLLGPSGSGKTTLLRIAAGLIRQSSGVVAIDDRVMADDTHFVPPEQRGIGLMFQDYALFPHLTILENVEFGLTALGRRQAREQANRVLLRVGMEERADEYPNVLSGGEQQRVALARTLAPRPGILLMDEPFAGLDTRLRDSVREQSLELLRETRTTAIIVTHDAEEALRVGDRVALIRAGQLVQEGSGHDLYYRPVNLFAARFFSELNVIPARLRGGKAITPFGDVDAKFLAGPDGHKVSVAIRLSDIAVKPVRKQGRGLIGQIINRRFIGSSELLEIHVNGLSIPLRARVNASDLVTNSSQVAISVRHHNMMVFDEA